MVNKSLTHTHCSPAAKGLNTLSKDMDAFKDLIEKGAVLTKMRERDKITFWGPEGTRNI